MALQLFQTAEIGPRISVQQGLTYYAKRLQQAIDGLAIGEATASAGTSATFWLGMDFGDLKAADLMSGLQGDIAKLRYTVALLADDGSLATDEEDLAAYDGKGILW